MPVSDPDVSRPRLIRDASFLEADRREIALRRVRHNANCELGRALNTEFVLQHMSEPQLRAKASITGSAATSALARSTTS